MHTLTEINIYPIKSLAGISLTESKAEERGLEYDRRWMLITSLGDFMTQREFPKMALLQPAIGKTGLKLIHKNNFLPPIDIPFEPYDAEELTVPIWEDTCRAITISREIDEWLSEILEVKCLLVYMPDSTERIVDTKYSPDKKIVSFADGYPFLIIGQSSLDDLNTRLEYPVPMNRFRPNLVFEGGKPFDEDNWKKFRINNVDFMAVKPSARCVITTVDQRTGQKGKEPLYTLSKFRKMNTKVLFGMNVISFNKGNINVGDKITHQN